MNFSDFLIGARAFIQSKEAENSIRFFQQDAASTSLWFEILINHYEKNTCKNVETLVNKIPKEFGSRPKIYSVINNALKLKFIYKERDKTDKRKYNLYATELTIKEFEAYVTKLTKILSDKN